MTHDEALRRASDRDLYRERKRRRDAEKAARKVVKLPPRLRVVPTAPNQRDPRQRDAAFLAWLHEGLPCIACMIDPTPLARDFDIGPNPIEAAHIKINIAAAGWKKISGKRTHDRNCLALCAWHHRLAPNACDNGQRQFMDRLGIGDKVADLCADLYAAFQEGRSGKLVVELHASRAREA